MRRRKLKKGGAGGEDREGAGREGWEVGQEKESVKGGGREGKG